MKLAQLIDPISGEFVRTVEHGGETMTLDHRAKTFIEMALGAKLAAVYSSDLRHPSKTRLELGCTTYLLVTATDKIVALTNSEWGALTIIGSN